MAVSNSKPRYFIMWWLLASCLLPRWFLPSCLAAPQETVVEEDNFAKHSNSWFWHRENFGTQYFYTRGEHGPQVILLTQPPPNESYQRCRADGACEALETCRQGWCIPLQNSAMYNSPCSRQKIAALQPPSSLREMVERQCYGRWYEGSAADFLVYAPQVKPKRYEQYLADPYLHLPYQPKIKLSWDIKAEGFTGVARGWGLWNSNLTRSTNAYAWFVQQEGLDARGRPHRYSGFWIMMLNPSATGPKLKTIKLPPLDNQWHRYEICWDTDILIFSIDEKIVHVEREVVPLSPMAFHTWINNALFDPRKIAMINPAMQVVVDSRKTYLAAFKLTSWSHYSLVSTDAALAAAFSASRQQIDSYQKRSEARMSERAKKFLNARLSYQRERLAAAARAEIALFPSKKGWEALWFELNQINRRLQRRLGRLWDRSGSLQAIIDDFSAR